VVGLYVLDEESRGVRPLGGATRWRLAHSLRSLQASLQAADVALVLRNARSPPAPRCERVEFALCFDSFLNPAIVIASTTSGGRYGRRQADHRTSNRCDQQRRNDDH
jgi:hypothetical protein